MTVRRRVFEQELATDRDVAAVRARVQAIAEAVGLARHDPTRLAIAVSEIARNALVHAGGGALEVDVLEGATPDDPSDGAGDAGAPCLEVTVRDHGAGIDDVARVLDAGTPGLSAARRMVDRFEVRSAPGGGTCVVLSKDLPRGARVGTAEGVARATQPSGATEELDRQTRLLARALDELRAREIDLMRVNRELEETNRGVVALYAELDQRAEMLARASETKSRFLSFMSHEFRTPLAAVLSLSDLLLQRADGPLTDEQEHQVVLIRRSSQTLSRLVEDLLDLAKAEAGRLEARPSRFDVSDLFAALRSIFRSVPRPDEVDLVVIDPDPPITMETDEEKLAQILRNLVSNALKFTDRGHVRVSARREDGVAMFECADTGIGIAREDQERIFSEFAQLDSPVQRRVRGTGLGLSLSRKLAELLGGLLEVESELDRGSTFRAVIPVTWSSKEEDEGRDGR